MKNDMRGLRLEKDAWIFSYRIAGRARRMTIGRAPGLTPPDARRAAQHFAGLVAIGRCPASERKTSRRREVAASAPIRDMIEKVAVQYLKHHRARVRPSTYRETARVFKVEILPLWKGRRLSEVPRQDVRGLIDRIVKRGAPVSANRTLASIKAWMTWAVSEDILTVSPAAAIKAPAAEKARERTLDDGELSAVWQASLTLGEYGTGVRLLALTGARRSEVFGMAWQEIDLAGKTWTLPAARAKNGRQHVIPLSEQALDVLRSLRLALTSAETAEVFPPIGFSQSKAKLDAELNRGAPIQLPPWTLHDLRRSAASGMASLGVRIETVEKILNHASGSFRGIVGVYQKYDFASEKRAALDLWAQHVSNLGVAPTLGSSVALSKAA